MKMILKSEVLADARRSERGAALVSTLLLAMLLLTAGGALVLTTTMSATNALDSTAEMQAYYGAEAGLQSTINVLRGNVWDSNATPDASFRAAVEPDASNVEDDPATDRNVARLSNWLDYDDDSDRVIVSGTDNRIAFDVTARDLDNSKVVSYSTSATFDADSSGCVAVGTTLTCTNGLLNSFILTYTPQPATAITAYPAVASGMGSFQLVVIGNGANIAAGNPAKLRLRINQTLPWVAYDTIIATISGNVNAANSTLRVAFSGSTVKVDGTSYALCAACNPLTLSAGATALSATVTAPQPKRILVRSTGYGPKGAIKRLEMVLNQSVFDFEPPAALTLPGAASGAPIVFDTGSSGAKNYSGTDNAGVEAQLPTFAVTGSDLTTADNGIKKHDTVSDPELAYLDNSTVPVGTTVSSIPVQTPDFLQSADNARTVLADLQTTAESMGRYFAPTNGDSYTVTSGNTTPTGITFIDGDCNLEGGSGLLVVTGNLNMNGNPNFEGVILVLGTGSVNRNGGGNGNIYGAMVVASFNRNGNGGFNAPSFTTNGGGNSVFQYDSLAVARAMGAVGTVSGGVREF